MSSLLSLPSLRSLTSTLAATLAVSASYLIAQAADVPIRAQTQQGLRAEDDAIGEQITALIAADKLATQAVADRWCKSPQPRALQLPPPHTQELDPPTIAARARKAHLRIGWCFLCTHCDHWHSMMGCGYAITVDGAIATCAHVLEQPPMEVRDARLVVITPDNVVHAVTSVLACDADMDAAIVGIDVAPEASPLTPLPLVTDVRPGDRAYCLSRPLEQRDYFSAGMVNRFYLDRDVAEEHGRDSLPFLAAVRMDVDMPWAPGSSGSALLDQRGNAIGHVSEIRPLSNGMPAPGMPGAMTAAEAAEGGEERDSQNEQPATLGDLEARTIMITLHVAVPVRGVQFLATMNQPQTPPSVRPSTK